MSNFDINAYIQAMMQMAQQQQQGRLQSQREQMSGRHLDMSGNDVQASSPWNGPLKFNRTAADVAPEDIARSQGSTAENQWSRGFTGSQPPAMTNAAGAMQASPPPFQISPESSAMVHGYGVPPPSFVPPKPAMPRRGSSFGFGATASPKPGFGF